MTHPNHLFTPLDLRSIRTRNRIFVSPMCQYSSTDGHATDWHLVHLGSYATGGAGLVVSEATAVAPEGRISYADLGIWDDGHVDGLRRITSFLTEHGAVPAIQLAHAGRKAATAPPWLGAKSLDAPGRTWEPVSATDRPFSEESPAPRRLTTEEAAAVATQFADAAGRAVDAGFRAVEIHAAHGYLLHQFLSPLTNDRDDRYGGDFDGRIRLLMETIVAIREMVGEDTPVMVRISATDWHPDGWTALDSVELARRMREAGVDFVDCSSGGIVPGIRIPTGAGYQTALASQVREGAGIATGAVGLITTPEQADQIIRSGQADAVLLGREMLRDPHWAQRAAKALDREVPSPSQYERAW